MFKDETVIILGAGASVQFGFPLAIKLHDKIMDGYSSLIQRGLGLSKPLGIIQLSSQLYEEDPYMAILSLLEHSPLQGLAQRESNDPFFKFHMDLKNGTHDTIDQFLSSHQQHHMIGKVLLSHHILSKMYKKNDFANYNLKTFDDRNINQRKNWYHSLIQELQKDANNLEGLMQNKLSIISFNYDLSLEQALSKRLGGEGDFKGADYKKFIDVFHINGAPENLPESIMDLGNHLIKSSSDLFIPNESVDNKVAFDRAEAQERVLNAKQIYILGFQFDQSNIETISLNKLAHYDHIFPLNYDGNRGTENRILNIGIPGENIFSGSPEAPLHIDQAIKDGLFETRKHYRTPRFGTI